MRSQTYVRGIGGILAGLMVATAAGETLEAVEKKIEEAAKKVKSIQGKMKTRTQISMEGFESVSDSEGTIEYLRKDGKLLYRSESRTTSTTKMAGQETKQVSNVVSVSDGEVILVLSDTDGVKNAIKSKAEPEQPGFEAFRKNADLKLLPDEKIAGKEVYVIETTSKDQPGQGRSLLYFLKDTGFMVKSVTFGPDGKPMTTTTFTDLKFGGSIPAERFKLEIPEGVPVTDMTKE